MPKKKKLTNPKQREARLQKARQWALTYEGSHIVCAYCKRFKVDVTCVLSKKLVITKKMHLNFTVLM